MALILPSRSTRIVQPQGPVEVNPQYLGKSPVLLASASTRFLNSVNGVPPVFGVGMVNSTAQFVPSPVGIGGTATVATTASSVLFPDFNFGGTKPITVIAFADAMPAANRSFLNQSTEIALRANSTGNGVEFILNSFTGADRVSVVAGSRASPGVFVAGTYGSSGKLRAYANGAFAEVTPGGTYAKRTDQFSAIFGIGQNQLFNTRLALVGLFESEFSIDELDDLNANPWQLFKSQSRSIIIDMGAGGGGTAYSLEVTPASYSLSGNDAALVANSSLIVTPGSYETTGVSADLTYTSAAAGYELSVTPGSYSLTGNDASLTATSILGITPGAYALTGNAADLSLARNLSVTPGDYSVTGEPVELTLTSSGFYVLDVSPGAYALSGADVALAYSAEVPAASMGFQLGGIREVTHKRLIDRILEARAERIKPVAKRARKRARVIEVQAAEIALTGNEAQFFGLMDDWLEQKPQLPPGIDAEEAFMAQVAMEVQRINERRLFEQDEEEALIALLLA